jgi:Tfp pilus assembly protein PilX
MQKIYNRKIAVFFQGSIAIFSLFIMFLLTIVTISIITTAALERKSSTSTGNSTAAFQLADSGIEKTFQGIMSAIKSDPSSKIEDICAVVSCNCVDVDGYAILTYSPGNKIKLYDNNTDFLSCTDDISEIAVVKSAGTYKQETRAIEQEVFCNMESYISYGSCGGWWEEEGCGDCVEGCCFAGECNAACEACCNDEEAWCVDECWNLEDGCCMS